MDFIKKNLVPLLMIGAGAALLLLGIINNCLYGGLFEFAEGFGMFEFSFWVGLSYIFRLVVFVLAVALVVLGALYLFNVLKNDKLGKILLLAFAAAFLAMYFCSVAASGVWPLFLAMIIAIAALVLVARK